MPETGKILDAGCGTGLTGNALKNMGYKDITGIDISRKSILLAQKAGAYSQLKQLDLQTQPFPFNQGEFDAVNCIGVLTYIKDPRPLFKEFCRIVRPSGYIVFSHREDLLKASRYFEILKELEDEGSWYNLFISEPKLYLPRNENFTDEVKVVYFVFQTR
jgi:predicted TPR repeat methyltransferase